MNESYNNAEISLLQARSLLSVLIAATMSTDHEPESDDYSAVGFMLDEHLGNALEALEGLREASKDKPAPIERVTTPESEDIHKIMRISDEIDKITDPDLKRDLYEAYLKVYKPYLGRELGFIPGEPEKATEAES